MTSVSLRERNRWPRAISSSRSAREVVDLAVEDELNRAVLVRHRLVGAGAEVDDLQPPETEAGAARRRYVRPAASGPRCEQRSRIAHDGRRRHRPAVERSVHRRCRTSDPASPPVPGKRGVLVHQAPAADRGRRRARARRTGFAAPASGMTSMLGRLLAPRRASRGACDTAS